MALRKRAHIVAAAEGVLEETTGQGDDARRDPSVEEPGSQGAYRYNAFISYSRRADANVARALQTALQRFAKPWHRMRAVHVFRDDTDLRNEPLLPRVRKALDESEFLVLLASPAAAESKWVGEEIEYWRANKDSGRVLLVLTDGELPWSNADRDFDWNAKPAVPRAISGEFEEEPRWSDVREPKRQGQLSLDDQEFHSAVVDIAASLHHVEDKSEIAGEHVRQHRRTILLARAAGAMLVALTVAALAFAVFALIQRSTAISESKTARSRELAVNSVLQLPSDPELSLLLAIEAAKIKETVQAEDALRQALLESKVRVTLRGHRGALTAAAPSPDWKRIVTSSVDGTARVWDAVSGKALAVLRGHRGAVNSATFSSDGRRVLTAGSDGTARIWSAGSGAPLAVLRGHRRRVNTAAFGDGDSLVVTASADRTARVWNVRTRKVRHDLEHGGEVLSATFGRNDELVLTTSADGAARVWEPGTGRVEGLVGTFSGMSRTVTSAAINPQGELIVTGSEFGPSWVWNANNGREVVRFLGHRGPVLSAAFDASGQYVITAGSDKTARVWNTATGEGLDLRGHDAPVLTASFGGGSAITGSADETARIWIPLIGRNIGQLVGHQGDVVSATLSSDGAFALTASTDRTARVWDVGPESLPLEYVVETASLSDDGRLVASADAEGAIYVSGIAGRRPRQIGGHDNVVESLAFNGNETKLVSAGSDVLVWDLRTEKSLTLGGDEPPIVSTATINRSGTRIVTVGHPDRTARLWDANTGRELFVLDRIRGLQDFTNAAAFSPDGSLVAEARSDGTVTVRSADPPYTKVSTVRHDADVETVTFSPDGERIATASNDKTARVWNARSGDELFVLRGHDGWVVSVDFSADGKWIVTAGDDGTVRFWSAETGSSVAVHRVSSVDRVEFGREDVALVVGGAARMLRCVVCAGIDELQERARSRRARLLSADERARFLSP